MHNTHTWQCWVSPDFRRRRCLLSHTRFGWLIKNHRMLVVLRLRAVPPKQVFGVAVRPLNSIQPFRPQSSTNPDDLPCRHYQYPKTCLGVIPLTSISISTGHIHTKIHQATRPLSRSFLFRIVVISRCCKDRQRRWFRVCIMLFLCVVLWCDVLYCTEWLYSIIFPSIIIIDV